MKLSGLADLAQLLEASDTTEKKSEQAQKKQGYDGKAVQLKISLDSKGRKGKTVTLISGFQSSPAELESLAQTLKKLCGTGGSIGDNSIELQGDHRQKASQKLSTLGYSLKQ